MTPTLRRFCSVLGAAGVLALGLLGSACTPPAVSLAEGPREYVAQDYLRVLHQWTRSTQLLSVEQLDNVLTVTGTYESWDFRWAYAIRYADDYRLTVDQRRALLERSLAEARREHHFYLALAAQKHKWGDLDVESPAWVIRLIDDTGSETAPMDLKEIKRPGPIEQTYFPYTNPWRRAYRISFPVQRADGTPSISPKATRIGLRFAGAQGNDELIWELAGPGSTGPDTAPTASPAAPASSVTEPASAPPQTESPVVGSPVAALWHRPVPQSLGL